MLSGKVDNRKRLPSLITTFMDRLLDNHAIVCEQRKSCYQKMSAQLDQSPAQLLCLTCGKSSESKDMSSQPDQTICFRIILQCIRPAAAIYNF